MKRAEQQSMRGEVFFFRSFLIYQTTMVMWEICFSTFQVMKQTVFAWKPSQSLHMFSSPTGAETGKLNIEKNCSSEAPTQKSDVKAKIVPLIVFYCSNFFIHLSRQYLFFSKEQSHQIIIFFHAI